MADNLQMTTIVLALALAWASGLRLYVVLLLVGVAGYFHWFGFQIPPSLGLLIHPIVIGTSALLVILEFFADKIPGVDTIWDAIHTFIRIPAGALLAAGVISQGDVTAWTIAAGLLGGTIAAGSHFLKAGSRAVINTSPEPVSNWGASFTEDAIVLGGLWLAFQHPLVFIGLLICIIALTIWLLPKIWRLAKRALRSLTRLTSRTATKQAGQINPTA